LPGLLAKALKSPGWQRHLGDIAPPPFGGLSA